jgi:hypothetical protein
VAAVPFGSTSCGQPLPVFGNAPTFRRKLDTFFADALDLPDAISAPGTLDCFSPRDALMMVVLGGRPAIVGAVGCVNGWAMDRPLAAATAVAAVASAHDKATIPRKVRDNGSM